MSRSAPRLARGLRSLIPPGDRSQSPSASAPAASMPDANQVRQIAVEHISPNPRQPRTTIEESALAELAESIRHKGVLQPVLVRATARDRYELVAGERRWRAARLAGLTTVPAIVLHVSDAESLETALVENLQREDLGPLERALAYQHYMETFGGTVDDLATRLGESRSGVANYLRLLKLHPEVCYMLGRKELGMGQARAIAGVIDPQRQLALARLAVRRNLSTRQVEELVRRDVNRDSARRAKEQTDTTQDSAVRHRRIVEEALSKAIGLPVRIVSGRRKNSGRVIISFATLEDFDRIAERIGAIVQTE